MRSAIRMIPILWAAFGLGAAAELPAGPGKAETVKLCGKCHSLDQAVSLRQGRQGWTETLSKMVNLGAQGSDEDLTAVLQYLVKFYGSAKEAPAASGSAAAAPEAPSSSSAALRPPVREERKSVPMPMGATVDPAKEWPTYGHDPGAMRFSPLKQITPQNAGRLKVAWVYHMKPEGFTASPAPVARRNPAAPVGDEPESGGRAARVQFGSGFRPSEVTPLVIQGVMYVTTPYGRVAAVDPVNGQELWAYAMPAGNPSTRGLEYWAGDGKTPAQIVFGSSDGKMYSLDAKTGKPNPAFGDNGVVNLNTPELMRGLPGRNSLTSPPIVYKHLVITGGTTQENPPHGPAGDVRAWDLRTGKLVWTFHSIPQAGEKYNDTWAGDSWKNRSGVNVWGFLTVDAQRGIIYMPFGAPSVDQYGGDRAGDNLFGTSLVAADANTGKYLWHFQVVHHDIWDADMTAAPALIDVKQGGKTIPAVVAMNKSGMVFLLNRITGQPIYGVKERPVPPSEVPLERVSKTQPFPVMPPPLVRMSFGKDEVATVTPELEAACRKLLDGMVVGGRIYHPPTTGCVCSSQAITAG
ncbi:MAG: PQQ-binding-like beta-propeller repeat protein [Paludibaculum sp.]